MNRRSSAARRRAARGAKWDPRQARLLMVGGGALLFVLISAFVWMLSGGPEPKELPAGPAPSAVWMSASSEESVPEAAESPEEEPSFSEEPSSRPEEDSPSEEASSEETPGSLSEAPSSQPEDSPSGTASSEETPGASSEAPSSRRGRPRRPLISTNWSCPRKKSRTSRLRNRTMGRMRYPPPGHSRTPSPTLMPGTRNFSSPLAVRGRG